MRYGSDLIVEWLVDTGITHVALNPGATIRGLHESLVRETRLTTVLALHEEIAIGVAHGFWKAAQRPMAVFLHDLVGIQHASMALFNASVDRAPMLVLGGLGPSNERERRPWLDWIHYSSRHDSAVHDVVKLAMEPSSLLGTRDAIIRGTRHMLTDPAGPVFIGIDTAIQEDPADDDLGIPAGTSVAGIRALPSADQLAQVALALQNAKAPAFIVDRPVPDSAPILRDIAERLGAPVVDLGGGFSYDTEHWTHQAHWRREVLAEADVIVVIEARDSVWALSETDTGTRATTWLIPVNAAGSFRAKIFTVGTGALISLPGVQLEQLLPEAEPVVADAGEFLRMLAMEVRRLEDEERTYSSIKSKLKARHATARSAASAAVDGTPADAPVHPARLVAAIGQALDGYDWILANGIVQGWPAKLLDIGPTHPFLGRSAGEGLGYGMPASLGAALAHRDDSTIVVNLQSDGDLMYTATALWTAANSTLPLLTVMYDNGTYGKDELHQRELATLRGRPLDTTHLAIRLDDPAIDFAALARSQGVASIGPIDHPDDVLPALRQAIDLVTHHGKPILLHVRCR